MRGRNGTEQREVIKWDGGREGSVWRHEEEEERGGEACYVVCGWMIEWVRGRERGGEGKGTSG